MRSRREPGPSRGTTRRAFLASCAGGILATAGTGAYARFLEPNWPAVEFVPLDLRNLDPPAVGLRVIQLSDLHVYRHVTADEVCMHLERCMALSPDLIVLTGDYITRGDPRYLDDLARAVRVLRAPHGVFAVLGNHDCGAHDANPAFASEHMARRMQTALTDCGITVLRNEMRLLDIAGAPLQLVGLDELWSGYCDPDQAFAEVDPEIPCIALAHNPDVIDDLRDQPCDWVLCGHTHGGQVRLPFIGALYVPVRNRQYDQGLFTVGEQRLYVNRGLGHLLPIRFNCRPEITVFTLSRRD